MHAGQHLELDHIEVRGCAHAGKDRLLCAGGPVHVEAQLHHPLDHGLDVLLGCGLLHCDNHCSSLSSCNASGCKSYVFRRCSVRITSMMRSYTCCSSASASGPGFTRFTWLKTACSRFGSYTGNSACFLSSPIACAASALRLMSATICSSISSIFLRQSEMSMPSALCVLC